MNASRSGFLRHLVLRGHVGAARTRRGAKWDTPPSFTMNITFGSKRS